MAKSIVSFIFLIFLVQLCLATSSFDRRPKNDQNDDNSDNFVQSNEINLHHWPSRIDPNFTCPAPYGRFGRVEDCRSYHWCKAGVARLVLCPPYTRFDRLLRTCMVDTYATCFEQNEEYSCDEGDGNFRANQCDRYWLCSGGRATLRYCPYYKLYDVQVRRCVYWFRAQCQALPANSITGTPTTVAPETTTILTETTAAP